MDFSHSYNLPTTSLIFFSLLIILPSPSSFEIPPSDSVVYGINAVVGVTYEPSTPGIPPPSEVVRSLIREGIPRVRLIDPDYSSISAFVDTTIDLNLSLEDLDLFRTLAANASFAYAWVRENVAPYYQRASITSVSVGYGILTGHPDLCPQVLPAVKNVYDAFQKLSLNGTSISTAHAYAIVTNPFPPSQSTFNATLAPYLKELLDFDADHNGALQIDLYPFLIYHEKRIPGVTVPFVMFEATQDEFLLDRGTGKTYHNLYDVMVDGAIGALSRMGHGTLPVLVVGTGWPTGGDREEVPEANQLSAAEYNGRLVAKLNSFGGTPLRNGVTPVTYIYGLFDEKISDDPKSFENNWGIMDKSANMKYQINFTADYADAVADDLDESGWRAAVGADGIWRVVAGACALTAGMLWVL